LLESKRVRLLVVATRKDAERVAVKILETVTEHRPVRFPQDVRPDLNHVVGADAQDVAVECRVVDLAQGEPVPHLRGAAFSSVAHDVRSIEEFRMLEPAYRAAPSVCVQDALPEAGLMEADQGETCGVSPPNVIGRV
jgi:hypothetical protein